MENTKNYICTVNGGKAPGRYRVGAKTRKETLQILTQACKTKKIHICYVDACRETRNFAKQGECFKEVGYFGGTVKRIHVQ